MTKPTDQSAYQWAEDSLHVSGDKGTAALVVRKDTGATIAGTDGDYTLLQVDATGALRVSVTETAATLNNGVETAVSSTAVQVLAANAARRKAIIQNVGLNPVRIGAAGVTDVSGVALTAASAITFNNPDCPTNAIFAIRDGLLDSIVLAQEVT